MAALASSTHTNRRSPLAALACLLVAVACTARADEAEPAGLRPDAAPITGTGLRVHGFGTLGFSHAVVDQGWDFRRDFNQPVRDRRWNPSTDSRLGLQVNLPLTPTVEAVAQAVLKDRASTDPTGEALSWAFVQWRPRDDLTLRAGRMALDLYQLSEYRNVGFAYTWVRPNVEFYGWIPMDAYEGADAVWQTDHGSAQWRVKAYTGRVHLPISAPGSNDTVTFRARQLRGVSLTREEAGFTLKLGYLRTNNGLQPLDQLQPLRSGLQALAALPLADVAAEAQQLDRYLGYERFNARYSTLGLGYDEGPWQIQVELSQVRSDLSVVRRKTGYVSVGRRFGSVTAFATAGRARNSDPAAQHSADWSVTLAPVLGPDLASAAEQLAQAAVMVHNTSRVDQSSRGLGLRWDTSARVALKVQWERFHVHPSGGTIWGNSDTSAARAHLLSVAMDFIF